MNPLEHDKFKTTDFLYRPYPDVHLHSGERTYQKIAQLKWGDIYISKFMGMVGEGPPELYKTEKFIIRVYPEWVNKTDDLIHLDEMLEEFGLFRKEGEDYCSGCFVGGDALINKTVGAIMGYIGLEYLEELCRAESLPMDTHLPAL